MLERNLSAAMKNPDSLAEDLDFLEINVLPQKSVWPGFIIGT